MIVIGCKYTNNFNKFQIFLRKTLIVAKKAGRCVYNIETHPPE